MVYSKIHKISHKKNDKSGSLIYKLLFACIVICAYFAFSSNVEANTSVSFEFQSQKYNTTLDRDVVSYVVIDNLGSVFLFATSIEDDIFCSLTSDWAYFYTNANATGRKAVWIYEYSFADDCFVYRTADWSCDIKNHARLARLGGNVEMYIIEDTLRI